MGIRFFFIKLPVNFNVPYLKEIMKSRKLIPRLNFKPLQSLGEKGQSIVEFVLLLLVITLVSYSFVAVMNGNIARYWEYAANLVVNDRAGGPKTVTLP